MIESSCCQHTLYLDLRAGIQGWSLRSKDSSRASPKVKCPDCRTSPMLMSKCGIQIHFHTTNWERLISLPWEYEGHYSKCASSTRFVSTGSTAQTSCSNGNKQLGDHQKEECSYSESSWYISTVIAFKCAIWVIVDLRNLQPWENRHMSKSPPLVLRRVISRWFFACPPLIRVKFIARYWKNLLSCLS
jgi:hypothetical protein